MIGDELGSHDIEIISQLEWENGIGTLPGTDIKFGLNSLGVVVCLTDAPAASTPLSLTSSGKHNGGRDDDSVGKQKMKRSYKKRCSFSWARYLESQKAVAAPRDSFHMLPSDLSYFKLEVGMKFEAIDPKHPWLYCVVSVMERRGSRLRIQFDGYAACYDFIANVNSPRFFPAGWCDANNKTLEPPRGLSTFSWESYMAGQTGVIACNEHFPVVPSTRDINGFILEALDEENEMRVGRVRDNYCDYVLIQFEALPQSCCKWFSLSSPCIKPFGWSNSVGQQIVHLSSDYLAAHSLTPLPSEHFLPRKTTTFEVSQKLEAVDYWNPILIRVCTIVDIYILDSVAARLKLHLDGWPERFSFWVDVDSDEIFYPGFCSSFGHSLTFPPSDSSGQEQSTCPTPECRGQGHVKGPRFLTHHNLQGCPYSPSCVSMPDRLSAPSSSTSHSPNKTQSSSPKITEPPAASEETPDKSSTTQPAPSVRVKKECKRSSVIVSSASLPPPAKVKIEATLPAPSKEDILQSIRKSVYPTDLLNPWQDISLCIEHQRKILPSVSKPEVPVASWSPDDVSSFVSSLSGCDGDVFVKEQIDGEAFLLLSQMDIVKLLSVKLGPALKIFTAIRMLKHLECSSSETPS